MAAIEKFFRFFLLFLPLFPLRKAELVPPPWGSKNHSTPAKFWLIPLPVADPTPTYGGEGGFDDNGPMNSASVDAPEESKIFSRRGGTRKIPCDEGKRREKKRMRMTIAKVAVVRDC